MRSRSSTLPRRRWNSSLRPRYFPKDSTPSAVRSGEASLTWRTPATPGTICSTPLIYTYAPEDLIERAAELHFECGASVYDTLFLALAEASNTVVITADDRLLRKLEGTGAARLVLSLSAAARSFTGNS